MMSCDESKLHKHNENENDYEAARKRNLQKNLEELQKLGFCFGANATKDSTGSIQKKANEPEQKKSPRSSKQRKRSHSATKPKLNIPEDLLRRSTRSKFKRELFQDQDFSEKAVAKRQHFAKHDVTSTKIQLKLLDNVLIDRLTREAYLKSLALKEARNKALDEALDTVDVKAKAKAVAKKRRLKRIEKFEAEYELLWVPKGSNTQV